MRPLHKTALKEMKSKKVKRFKCGEAEVIKIGG